VTLKQLVTEINSAIQKWPGKSVDLLNERTCYFYRNQGILAAPLQAGPLAQYGEQHVKQLLAVKVLQRAGKSLAEIKAQMARLTEDELTDLLLNSGITLPLSSIHSNGELPRIFAQEEPLDNQPGRNVEPYGVIQVQEPGIRLNQLPNWSCYPLNRNFTVIGAPGAPALSPAVLQQIQQLLTRAGNQ
jgi:DNA-binding transcriptional MerR regulator